MTETGQTIANEGGIVDFINSIPAPPTWNFEGKEYPAFVVNKNDSIAMQIKNSEEKVIGILGANFRWEKSEPFIEHLSLDFKDIRDTREGVVESQRKNLTKQNANLFKAVCVGGFLIKVNEFGEHSEPVERSVTEMNAYSQEIKSNLIDKWLSNFHIERHFGDSVDELDALLGKTDSISFKCFIGTKKEPTNVLLLEFNVPSEDARRSYDDMIVNRSRQTEGSNEITNISINYAAKMRYAKKHLAVVQGAVTEGDNPLAVDVKRFNDGFNPEWLMRLADALQDTFDIGGK